jgi:hypothetical protein
MGKHKVSTKISERMHSYFIPQIKKRKKEKGRPLTNVYSSDYKYTEKVFKVFHILPTKAKYLD